MIDRSFGSIYFLPCSNSLLGIATSHIGLIRSLYCSVFKEPSLFKRLDYLTTFVEVCQIFFSNYFSSLFRTGPLHQRRVLYYHIHGYCVNRVFEKSFGFRVRGSGFGVQGSGLARGACCPLIGDEIFAHQLEVRS